MLDWPQKRQWAPLNATQRSAVLAAVILSIPFQMTLDNYCSYVGPIAYALIRVHASVRVPRVLEVVLEREPGIYSVSFQLSAYGFIAPARVQSLRGRGLA